MKEGAKERFYPHNSVNSRLWRTAVYVRLSDEDRDKGREGQLSRSIENQIAGIRNYIACLNRQNRDRFPMEVEGVYADDDYTGMDFKREAFQRMMNQIRKGQVDCIVVKNLSRLGRHDREMQRYLEEEFEQPGKQVRVVAIGDHYDSLYDSIDILIKIKLLFNREYSENQHRNVCAGMAASQKQGKFIGAFAPYGYQKDPENKHRLVIDSYAAEIVKGIFTQYLSGCTPAEIAETLNREGVLNRCAYKSLHGSSYVCGKKKSRDTAWTKEGVRDVLKNEMYTGTMVQGKTFHCRLTDTASSPVPKEQWIRVQNTHEPILSPELWVAVQHKLDCSRRRIPEKGGKTEEKVIYLFAGLAECGICGQKMSCRRDWYLSRKGEKRLYKSYRCKNCSGISVSERMLYEAVQKEQESLEREENSLAKPQHTIRKSSEERDSESSVKNARITQKLQQISRERHILQERISRLEDKWLDGFLTDVQYHEKEKQLKDRKACLERESRFLKSEDCVWMEEKDRSLTDYPAWKKEALMPIAYEELIKSGEKTKKYRENLLFAVRCIRVGRNHTTKVFL